MLQDPQEAMVIKDYLGSLCLNIADVGLRKRESERSTNIQPSADFVVTAAHTYYDEEKRPTDTNVIWDWENRESSGSTKAMNLSGSILTTLKSGGVLLIFATHDTNLLSSASLRRDQIYFAEKNEWESTEFYSLSDFKYITQKEGMELSERERPDADKEGRYIEGRYGAIPLLGKLNEKVKSLLGQKEAK